MRKEKLTTRLILAFALLLVACNQNVTASETPLLSKNSIEPSARIAAQIALGMKCVVYDGTGSFNDLVQTLGSNEFNVFIGDHNVIGTYTTSDADVSADIAAANLTPSSGDGACEATK